MAIPAAGDIASLFVTMLQAVARVRMVDPVQDDHGLGQTNSARRRCLQDRRFSETSILRSQVHLFSPRCQTDSIQPGADLLEPFPADAFDQQDLAGFDRALDAW